MKLLNKIFKKGLSSSPSASSSSSSSSDERRKSTSSPNGNGRVSPSPYHCTATVMSPRTGAVSAAKVLRILGVENKDQENQIIRTMKETMPEEPDSADISFEEDYFPDAPSFPHDHSLAPARTSSDTDTFDRSSSRSMSPTSSSRLSPANDPWCRSPQHSPRAAAAYTNNNNNNNNNNVNNTPTATYSNSSSRALPLPVPLRDRVGIKLRVATPTPLPLPQVEDLSSAVTARLNSTSNSVTRSVTENRPSPPSPLRFQQSPRRPVSPQKSPPRSLMPCRKLHELGRGSFATVYEGFMDDGSFCAIKVIHDSTMADSFKEVSLLSQLNHQNIVRYLGACIDENGCFCIILELMKYSLKSILNRLGTGFEESTIRSYTRQILHGLAYLHEHNTIHRDIKCANILVDSQGLVKLADFGVAKQTPAASSLKGTPIFMAPEVMTPNPSKRSYGTAVDIWSLGCTVLEMASGQAPWSDLGFAFYFKLSRGEAPPIPDSLSPTARDFVRRCLCINPDGRPTARELLFHDFVVDAPSSVPYFSPPLMSPRASPMHRHGPGPGSNMIQETAYFHSIEGLRRNGHLNMITREDSGFSSLINRTRLEPQQLIFRSPHGIERDVPELQGLVL